MGHPYWLKNCAPKSCSDCAEEGFVCKLDNSIPSSPDCDGLDGETGEPMFGYHCDG